MLDVVFPVRVSSDRLDVLDRIGYFLLDSDMPSRDEISFTVADDGSPEPEANEIRVRCEELGVKYIRIDSELRSFSAGRARNYAAQRLTGKYILFQDVDLMPYPGFYRDLIDEIEVQELDKYADRFVMVGVIYLSDDASREYRLDSSSKKKSKYIQRFLEFSPTVVEKFSTGTSVVVWRRDHYLCTGGHDEEFECWGYEDLEYNCRAIRRNRVFPFPEQFNLDLRGFSNIYEYRGWKSIYRLFGDITFHKGIVMFHSWHPVSTNSEYQKKRAFNKSLFEKKLAAFASAGEEPPYLPIASRGKTLAFRDNIWTLNRWTGPFFGEIVVVDESKIEPDSFIEYLTSNGFDRVLFFNPYANDQLLSLYFMVRKSGYSYFVCERGALRDSIFIDPCGFNADSKSYSPENWNHEIDSLKRERTISYIANEKSNPDSLERQGVYRTGSKLRKKLGLGSGRKVLFVPLQRPSDTVIKYFCGNIESFDNFIELVKSLVERLPPDWDVVVKRHPLETVTPDIPGAVFADDENIKSLIELSDAILLINSGVGVLGLLYEKPVLVAGNAFYCHDKLALSVENVEEIVHGISSFSPDRETVLRFFSYLINDFYSFGEFKTKEVDWEDGSKMTATIDIGYYIVRLPGYPELVMERAKSPRVVANSILFDRYKDVDGKMVSQKSQNVAALVGSKNNQHSGKKTGKELTRARWRKFQRDPGLYMRDSKHFFLRFIGKFLR